MEDFTWLGFTLDVIFVVVSATAAILVPILVAKVSKWIGVTVDEKNQARIDDFVKQAISYAEEKSVGKLKGQAKVEAAEKKLDDAMTFLCGKTGMSKEDAEMYIHAKLPAFRIAVNKYAASKK